jgi:hypothetical protein
MSLIRPHRRNLIVRPEDIAIWLHARPFVPFNIHMTDGQVYEIVHPEAVLLLRTHATIGLRPDPKGKYYRGSEMLGLIHVVRLSPILPAEVEQSPSTAN